MKSPPQFITPPTDKYIGFITGHLLKARARVDFYVWMSTFGEYTRFRLGGLNVYLFTNPDAVGIILKKNARNYTKETPSYKAVARVTGKGIFTEREAPWLKIRKVAQPFFINKQATHWETITEKVCLDLELELDEISKRGEVYNFSPLMTKLALRVLGESIFDKDLGKDWDVFDKELGNLIRITNDIMTSQFSFNIFKKRKNEKEFTHSMNILEKLLSDLIDESKKEEIRNPNNMIHAFLNSDEESSQEFLIDQVKTMVFAGHETTSNSLSWILHFLSIHPEWQDNILLDLKSLFSDGKILAKDIGQCQKLEIFINETLRMYPPAWGFSRRAIADDVIEGYALKTGSVVTVSPFLMGHDSKYWIEPELFNPMRFVEQVHLEKRHPNSFIPFGLGPRACIGEKLSRLEMMMIISTFILHYKIIAPENSVVEMEPSITLSVKGGIHLKLIKRI